MTYEWKDLGECSCAEVIRELQGRVEATAKRVDMRQAETQDLRRQMTEADGELRKRLDKAEIGLKSESACRRQQVDKLSQWCVDLQGRIAALETDLKALWADTARNDGIAKAESDRRHVELVGYIRAVEKRMDGLQVHAAAQEASLGQLERKLETAREAAVKSGLKEVCSQAVKDAGPAPLFDYCVERRHLGDEVDNVCAVSAADAINIAESWLARGERRSCRIWCAQNGRV